MRLGEFIDGNLQAILGEWEVFAQSIWPETSFLSFATARNSTMRSFTFSRS